jgi:DNA-binding GntR family transcriptional regulator
MPKYRYQQVTDDLRARIRDGTYAPGTKLPSRSELCTEFGVSEIIVGTAMRALRGEGLVETMHGVGVFVCDPLPGPAGGARSEADGV